MRRDWLCGAAGFSAGIASAYLLKEDLLLAALFLAASVCCALSVRHCGTCGEKLLPKLRAAALLSGAAAAGILRMRADGLFYPRTAELDGISGRGAYETSVREIELREDTAVLRCGQLLVYWRPAKEGPGGSPEGPEAASEGPGERPSGAGEASAERPGRGIPGEPDLRDSTGRMLRVGSRVTVTGDFSRMERSRNPGGFDYALYYRSKGITHRCFADTLAVKDGSYRFLGQALFTIRRELLLRLDRCYDAEDAGVLRAALLGDRSRLDEDLYEMYRKNGIAHLLAISGLHAGIVGLGLYRGLRRAGAGFTLAGAVSGIWILLYGTIAGMGVSVLRAAVMLLLLFLAGREGRGYDLLSAAGFAAVLVLLIHPCELMNCGFLLSFSAVLAIGGPAAAFRKAYGERGPLWSALETWIAIHAFTAPVVAYFFFELPLYGVILNLAVIPLMAVVIWSGLAAVLLTFLPGPAAVIAAGSGHYVLRFYTFLCGAAERLPLHSILTGRPESWQIFVYYALLSCYWYCFLCRPRGRS